MVSPPNDDIAELVALTRDGDVRASARLMEAQQPRLMGQALAFCGEVQLARRERRQELRQHRRVQLRGCGEQDAHHDWHATILALLGLDHEKLTYRYAGRDFRLTDVTGNVAKEILA